MILDRFTDEQLDNLQVYLQENKGDKEISKSNFYFDRKGLYLKKSVLKAGWEYGIYVTYPGGSTGVYTFVYGEELISNEHWYKRNYADRDGKELPDIDDRNGAGNGYFRYPCRKQAAGSYEEWCKADSF